MDLCTGTLLALLTEVTEMGREMFLEFSEMILILPKKRLSASAT
jgi:hypothetical protein